MSSHSTTTPADAATGITRTPSSTGTAVHRSRTLIVACGLVLGPAAVATVLLWRPWPQRNALSYAVLAPVRDSVWLGALIDASGYAVLAVALAIGVCLLAPARGATWASIGGVFAVIGGALTACGTAGLGVLTWYGTGTAAAGSAMDLLEASGGHAMVPEILGFLLLNAGVLLLMVALWRSRAVPRWLPVLTAVLVAGQFAGLPSRALDLEQVALMATFAALAYFVAAPARH